MICPVCEVNEFESKPKQKPRKHCSNTCHQQAYRDRQTALRFIDEYRKSDRNLIDMLMTRWDALHYMLPSARRVMYQIEEMMDV